MPHKIYYPFKIKGLQPTVVIGRRRLVAVKINRYF